MRNDDKTKARVRIGELLNICRKCPYGGLRNSSRYVQQCETCDVYEEMRALGDWLIKANRRPKNLSKRWTDKELRILIENVHLTDKELAMMLNRTILAIRNQIGRLKRKGLL